MAIIKVSKKKEDVLEKIVRQRKEAEMRAAKKLKEKELAEIAEHKRLESIVYPYLDKLYKQLREKESMSFWTFPDRAGFKKLKNMSFDDIQKMVKSDVKKYANRKICFISILTHHRSPKDSIIREHGILLNVIFTVFQMDDKCNLHGDIKTNGCAIRWLDEDFKITKLTFKLLETIMHPIADFKHKCSDLIGFPLGKVIADLQRKGVDFTDVLTPLSGC